MYRKILHIQPPFDDKELHMLPCCHSPMLSLSIVISWRQKKFLHAK